MSENKVVCAIVQTDKKVLSPTQKQFNNLSKKIDKEKKKLLDWQQILPLYHQKMAQEYDPLYEKLDEHKANMVLLFDQHYDNPLFKKADKAKISHLIQEMAGELIAEADMDELKPLFDKYSDEDYDTIKQETEAVAHGFIKNMMESFFDVQLDDDIHTKSPEEIKAHLEAKLSERQAQQQAQQKTVKKTKKQLEREKLQQQEQQLASKTVQEVYRKLVAVLHPDRESDEQERERKTQLMQRVNIAYDKKDLLQLLALQLEIEQIDAEHLNQIADDRLKYFNKILKEQLRELEQENFQIERMLSLEIQTPIYGYLTPKKLMSVLAMNIEQVKQHIININRDFVLLQNPAEFKKWLKTYKIPKPDMDFYEW